MKILYHIGWELKDTCKGTPNHKHVTACLARSLTKVGNLLHFLPDPVQKVANGKLFDLLPDQLRILFHLGWELWHSCKGNHNHVEVTKCLARSLAKFSPPLDFLPDPLKKVASGDIMGLLPGQLNKIADGNIMGLLPGQLKKIADGNIMGLLPGQLKKIADGNIMGLLPGQLNKIADGNIMGLLPGQLNQIADGNIVGLMPGPMQLLGGGQANSIQNMLSLGDTLMDCADSQQSDLVKCLGFKIISSNPPLNFLNRLGDIFAEFVGTFAKVAAAVATQTIKGGQSLLQAAATSEFPKAGAPAVVHHQTPNFIISKHSQHSPLAAGRRQAPGRGELELQRLRSRNPLLGHSVRRQGDVDGLLPGLCAQEQDGEQQPGDQEGLAGWAASSSTCYRGRWLK